MIDEESPFVSDLSQSIDSDKHFTLDQVVLIPWSVADFISFSASPPASACLPVVISLLIILSSSGIGIDKEEKLLEC